ncbi:MAG: 3-methyl-2-oxobutanoate hydroxymethyltransferase [Desulfobacterales bacterium]|nr:3-methyl-2-oxobutanoate hydroxymethyltransferase [Desulfobacterales bacterium]
MERKKITIPMLYEKKQQGVKTTNIVCYDYIMGSLVDQAGIDTILVGDSAEMVMMGNPNTLAVSVDEMIYHCKGVMRAVKYAFVVGDMPFLSYQTGTRDAIYNAGLFMKHAGVDAVKLEGGREVAPIIKAISDTGIPVAGDIGLSQESLAKLEGNKVQGNDAAAARKLIDDALALEAAGAFCLDLKFVSDRLAELIAKKLKIPVYGFACGVNTDGQFLNIYDLVGMFDRVAPKFVKKYGNLSQEVVKMLKLFMEDVHQGAFPGEEHSYHIKEELLKEVLKDKD